MDDKQVCVPCVCSYRINPQHAMENNREQSIILLHQMQPVFPQLSPFSFSSRIPAHLPHFFPPYSSFTRVRNTNTMFQVHTLIIYLHRRRFAVRERISRSQIQSSKADPAHPPFSLFIKSKLNEDLIYKSKQ